MNTFITFIISFIIIYVFYLIFVVVRRREYDFNKAPIEVKYLVKRYKFDMKKLNYRKLLHLISIISAFDMAIVVTIVFVVPNIILAFCLGFVLIIILILISYGILGKCYVKKGMVKNV